MGILKTALLFPAMKEPEFRITQRMLPHWEYDGSIYFITFNTWERLTLSPRARQVVLDACLFFNTQRYDLFALVVMPDHVHMLIQPLLKTKEEFWPLSSIMHSIKSYSAKQIPKVIPHIGTLWQPERYDHIVRDDRAFTAIWNYICQNPVKAQLASSPNGYPCLWQKT
jgi:REP element-mobilizing transposase RayT